MSSLVGGLGYNLTRLVNCVEKLHPTSETLINSVADFLHLLYGWYLEIDNPTIKNTRI